MKQLLALRILEEERVEAELSKQRRLRQICLNELRASEERSAAALRALYIALEAGDQPTAVSAEMAIAIEPLERSRLHRELTRLNPIVEAATSAWHNGRMCREQIETLANAAATKLQREMELRQQKSLDGWFLANLIRRNTDESFQRKACPAPAAAGTVGAKRNSV